MAKLSLGQKCARGTQFLSSLTKPQVAEALARIGFTDDDREDGYRRIREVTAGLLHPGAAGAADPRVVERLDAWENRWYPVCEATLEHRFPAMHAYVFANLHQTEGPEVIVSVGTLLDRLESAKTEGVEGADAALELLARRGVDAAQLAAARAILGELRVAPRLPAPSPIGAEELARREDAMWSWYLEWSKIARAAITSRGVLRAMGFLEGSGATEAPAEPAEPDASDLIDA